MWWQDLQQIRKLGDCADRRPGWQGSKQRNPAIIRSSERSRGAEVEFLPTIGQGMPVRVLTDCRENEGSPLWYGVLGTSHDLGNATTTRLNPAAITIACDVRQNLLQGSTM